MPDLCQDFGRERLGLTERLLDRMLEDFLRVRTAWEVLIDISFLAPKMKEKYFQVLADRYARIFSSVN